MISILWIKKDAIFYGPGFPGDLEEAADSRRPTLPAVYNEIKINSSKYNKLLIFQFIIFINKFIYSEFIEVWLYLVKILLPLK